MKTNVTVKSQWNGKPVKIKAKAVANKSAFEIGLIVEGQAKLLTPVKTGRLAGSITTQAQDHGTTPEAPAGIADVIKPPREEHEVLVGTAVEYGPYVEFGTVHSNAQPFLRPALDIARGQGLTVMQKNGHFEFQEYLK